MKYKIIISVLSVFHCFYLFPDTADYLHTDGTRIVDFQGKEVWLN